MVVPFEYEAASAAQELLIVVQMILLRGKVGLVELGRKVARLQGWEVPGERVERGVRRHRAQRGEVVSHLVGLLLTRRRMRQKVGVVRQRRIQLALL